MHLKKEQSVLMIDSEFLSYLSKIDIIQRYRLNKSINTDDLLDLSIELQSFLIKKFNIENEFLIAKNNLIIKNNIFFHRQNFIQRFILKKYSSWQGKSFDDIYSDEEFCSLIESNTDTDLLINYATWAIFNKNGQIAHKNSKLFNPPKKINLDKLFDFEVNNNIIESSSGYEINRKDYNLSTNPSSLSTVSIEANYCLYCHKRNKDTCRTGIAKETTLPNGCPMDQKISEMNFLAKTGDIIAAIGIAMIDNPFLLLTGHRICNDCIKGCIFQNQTAVDVPSIESGLIDILLKLPFGFEIYALLLDWNPLSLYYKPKQFIDKKALVCGLGPAGIALSYYFLRLGWEVFAIDSVEIKELENDPNIIIKDFSTQIEKPLEQRKDIGFGGVMEHGITARWNKNFLTAMHIILKRNSRFSCKGYIEFGKDIDFKTAQEQGFNYIALAIGSGDAKMPKELNYNIDGVWNSKDFLIKVNIDNNFINLNLMQEPVIIIGSGLTAIDCAVEAIVCLKKNNQKPNVTIISRHSMIKSVAYLTNHEEIKVAMENGVKWIENFETTELLNNNNKVYGIKSKNNHILNAKTVIIAVGTELNMIKNYEIINNEYKILDYKNDEFCIAKNDNISVGIFGDANSKYRGTVVKALASAKKWYLKNYVQD